MGGSETIPKTTLSLKGKNMIVDHIFTPTLKGEAMEFSTM